MCSFPLLRRKATANTGGEASSACRDGCIASASKRLQSKKDPSKLSSGLPPGLRSPMPTGVHVPRGIQGCPEPLIDKARGPSSLLATDATLAFFHCCPWPHALVTSKELATALAKAKAKSGGRRLSLLKARRRVESDIIGLQPKLLKGEEQAHRLRPLLCLPGTCERVPFSASKLGPTKVCELRLVRMCTIQHYPKYQTLRPSLSQALAAELKLIRDRRRRRVLRIQSNSLLRMLAKNTC